MTTLIAVAERDCEHVAWMNSSHIVVDRITTPTVKLQGID
jgi:hypothetical protein